MRWIAALLVAIGMGLLTLDWTDVGAQNASPTVACDSGCTLKWQPPTSYTDGTMLIEQDLDFYSFYCDDAHVMDFDAIVGTWQADITFTQSGHYICGLTTTTLKGVESELSNTLTFTKGPRVPRPPVLLP